MTQWTIAVEHDVNNYAHGHGRRNIEFTHIRLSEEALEVYRSGLGTVAESTRTVRNSEWKEIAATGALQVSEYGIMSLIRLCSENEAFMAEFDDLLQKVWWMGRAYERDRLSRRDTPPDPGREDVPIEEASVEEQEPLSKAA